MKKIIFILICIFSFNCLARDFGREFYKAVTIGDIATVEKMVNYYSFEINGKKGDSGPLHWAAEHGQAEMIQWLISKGAKVNARDMSLFTPLHYVGGKRSTTQEYFKVTKILITNGADINAKGGKSAVGGYELKQTPLFVAARSGNFEIVKLLVESGADVNAEDYQNVTPLHEAASHGSPEMVEYLILKGADVNAKSKNNPTSPIPIFSAVARENMPMIKVFLLHGADIKLKNYRNETPYEFAVRTDRQKMAEFLKKAEEEQAKQKS